jgi:isopenicillin-N epimerase
MHRRDFLGATGGAVGATTVASLFAPAALQKVQAATHKLAGLSPQEAARDESFWREIQQAFSINRSMINLDNGSVCPSPRVVTEALVRYTWEQEDAPGFMIWQAFAPLLQTAREGLAKLFGCDAVEIAVVRNATEALNTILLGIELRPGDEVLTTTHDYTAMQDALDQRSRREGIVVKKIDKVPMPPRSLDELLGLYERGVTPKTRLILVTHPVNYTGQLFPVKQICEMAHRRGIEVAVDGAQSFANVDYKLSDLGCDYFGTSLHKWLLAPIGTGMMYIRKEKISKVWPLFPQPVAEVGADNILKFAYQGTQSAAMWLAISEALAFHDGVGPKRKEERLRYLTRHWADRVSKLPNARFLTSFAPEMSCGLATFELTGIDPKALERHLWQRHRILVQSMVNRRAPEIRGVRVTPNLYTTLGELDSFCEVIEQIAKNGLPK